MFTGIVEMMGRVRAVERTGDTARLTVELGDVADGLEVGGSVAVDGCCLTVTALDGDAADFDVMGETLLRTTLGDREPGDPVNLERSLRADARLDGHVVQGHVDAVGEVTDRDDAPGERRFRVQVDPAFARQMVEKGSVAVDGASLTVAAVGDGWFEVALIPHTLQVTTWGRRNPGDRVNVETDILGKYAVRLLEPFAPDRRRDP